MKNKIKRYITSFVEKDLKKKMVFIGGPRQAGKTTLALSIIKGNEKHPAYFNYDHALSRERILKAQWPKNRLIVLDEVHKFRKWKGWLKGVFDTSRSTRTFLVTGSARLDLYRRGGDSLMGRYHYFRLHPLSVAEIQRSGAVFSMKKLNLHGGFPEPYFAKDAQTARRWRRERRSNIVHEDIRDLEQISDLGLFEMLVHRLPAIVGSPLSINGLAEDLQVSHKTIARWIEILERMYFCYRVYPYGTDKIRAVKKEAKLYLWDWADVENPGFRFENLVAGHLLKYCHFVEDTQGYDMELRYLRDTDGREVDFVVLQDRKPLFAVECKLTDPSFTKSMQYFRDRVPIPKFYLVHAKGNETFLDTPGTMESIPAAEFLSRFV